MRSMQSLTPLTSFILPGGSPAAAHLHLARAMARSAERAAAHLLETETASPITLKYLNRLSDLLFVLRARRTMTALPMCCGSPGANR